jgi:hypothetical protein
MSRVSGFAVRFLGKMAGFSVVMALVVIIGLISEVVGLVQQVPVQHGIDQHKARWTATYTDRIPASVPFGDDTYILTYSYGGHDFSTRLRGLPGNPQFGDVLCVEIDLAQPNHGRVCGTRGGLGDAESGLIWGGSILTVLVGIVVLYYRLIRSQASTGPTIQGL